MVVDNRPFHYAIAASLALHALLLFGLPDLIDTARRVVSSPPPLLARLMAPEPAAPPPAPVEAQPEKKKVEPPKPMPRIAKPAPEKVVPEINTEQAAPPVAEPVPAPPPPVAAVAPQQATTPSVQAAPTPAAPAPAPETLSRDQYRIQLIEEANRHKRYPRIARDNNWAGVVGISVVVAANGRSTVALKTSSGYDVIDQQALEMFRAAARDVPVPSALRGTAFALDLRIRYALED